MNVARCCCVAPNVNNLTHPPASSHSLPFPPPTLWHAMWGNICLRGTLTIFGYLHLICIARNAMRYANYNAYAPGQTRESTTAPLCASPCACLWCSKWLPHCVAAPAQSIFGMSLPITPFQYLRRMLATFLFSSLSLSLFSPLSLSAVSETTNQPGKTATIEMYAPSSYNDTVTGETLSSVSEKSESYSNEGSQPEYIVSIQTHRHISRVFSCPATWICNFWQWAKMFADAVKKERERKKERKPKW